MNKKIFRSVGTFFNTGMLILTKLQQRNFNKNHQKLFKNLKTELRNFRSVDTFFQNKSPNGSNSDILDHGWPLDRKNIRSVGF